MLESPVAQANVAAVTSNESDGSSKIPILSTPTDLPEGAVISPTQAVLSPTNGPVNIEGKTLVVVDPLGRKLTIPRDCITETRAMARSGVPSLCQLHLAGRCRQGSKCHQVHADPDTVAHLRHAVQTMPTCCQQHGDVNDTLRDPAWRSLQLQVQGVNVPLERVGYTAGLRRLIQESSGLSTIIIHPNSVCRLHAADCCRYNEDCRFIHVCRDIITQQLSQWVTPLVPDLELKHQEMTERRRWQQQQMTRLAGNSADGATLVQAPLPVYQAAPNGAQAFPGQVMMMPLLVMPQQPGPSQGPAGWTSPPPMAGTQWVPATSPIVGGPQHVLLSPNQAMQPVFFTQMPTTTSGPIQFNGQTLVPVSAPPGHILSPVLQQRVLSPPPLQQ